MNISTTRLFRYGVAIASVIAALLLTLLLQPWFKEAIFSLFFAAVMLNAWYGELEAGLLATVVSVIVTNYFLIPIADPLPLRNGAILLHLVLFSVVAMLISSLSGALRSARRRAEANLAALQLSEERYRRIVDTAYEGIWLVSTDFHTEYVNQRLTEILGYSPAELHDRRFYNCMTPETQAEAQKVIARLTQGVALKKPREGYRQQFDGCFCALDGSHRWAIVSITPILNAQSNLTGLLIMLTDITERKQAEVERLWLLEQEQAARAEAEAANQAKDQFLAVLSHELRAPLSPILGWAKLLQGQKLDSTMSDRAIEVIERNARLQTQLIEDLLDVSRIVQGKLILQSCPVNLVSVIESVIETVRLSAVEKVITLSFSTLDAEWENLAQLPESFSRMHSHRAISTQKVYVSGDASRLQQVVWNLLSNAVKFTPRKGQVKIQLQVIDCQNDVDQASQVVIHRFAQIQIADTGKGIHPDFLPYVFEAFRQEDSTTTREFGGLGLGLAIVRHLVELQGGTVAVESLGEDQGATFIVMLPLLELQQSCNDPIIPSFSALSEAALPLSGIKILVVEDEADTQELIVFILEQSGAIVSAVRAGDQALQILEQTEQHLLISDIGMPEMDGYTLMRQIRTYQSEKIRGIAAIALTAYANETDQRESKASGFQMHLVKPVDPDELVSSIVKVMASSF